MTRQNCGTENMIQVLTIVKEMKDFFIRQEWADRIAALEDVEFLARQAVFEYAHLLSMSDKDFEQFLNHYKELRRILRSCIELPDQSPKGLSGLLGRGRLGGSMNSPYC